MEINVNATGRLECGARSYRCALGRGGVTPAKREGDGCTPSGRFSLRRVLYRPDRVPTPVTSLPTDSLAPDQGWCDDPRHQDYNRLVQLPFSASHEKLWRDDNLYDVIVVLGHNDDPPIAGKGSAIFMHVAGPDYLPTEGCVALSLPHLLAVLTQCGGDTAIRITP
jgi:L,D-peptidoglycan transpeptidase YkuD (ErfK/YbiS/YcfS/YnhG family)